MTTWRMRIACWIPKATNTHSQYVILIAFPLQHQFHERTSMLRYTYIALFCYNICSYTYGLFEDGLWTAQSIRWLEDETDDGHIGEGLQSGYGLRTLWCQRLLPCLYGALPPIPTLH
jgi:hypothetical protein